MQEAYNRTDLTIGLGFKPASGAIFKVDYQTLSNAADSENKKGQINIGVGVWF